MDRLIMIFLAGYFVCCLFPTLAQDNEDAARTYQDRLDFLAELAKEPIVAIPGNIHSAALAGDLDEVEKILAEDPSKANLKDERGSTPLHTAVNFDRRQVIGALVRAGADINARSADLATPLIDAANGGYDRTVVYLLKAGADVHLMDDMDETPLHWAARKGHLEVARILLAAGARKNARNKRGNSPADLARIMEFYEMVTLLEGR